MTEEEVAVQIKTPAVLTAFSLAKISEMPVEVLASCEDEDKQYDRYSQHTADLIRNEFSAGEKSSKIEVARKLLAMNFTVDQIEKATGLSSEDIKVIK